MKYDYSLGYGTNYEKFILKEYFNYFLKKYKDISTVLEFPANNLLGQNSEVLEDFKDKKEIFTLSDINKKNELPYKSFDLVWNFCEFENNKNSKEFLEECFNSSKNKIFIITQNCFNPGIPIHKLWHLIGRYDWDHGYMEKMNILAVEKYLSGNFKNKFKVLEKGAFDLPWFVLDIYESASAIKEKLFKKQKTEIFEETDINQKIRKSFLEKISPLFLRFLLAHSHYILLEKK